MLMDYQYINVGLSALLVLTYRVILREPYMVERVAE